VALNIKNERVCRLARLAADRAGTSQVSVLEAALEQFLASLDEPSEPVGEGVDEREKRIAREVAQMRAMLTSSVRTTLRAGLDDLYEVGSGLPR